MIIKLKQAIVKESVVGELSLSTLGQNFYQDVREYLKTLEGFHFSTCQHILESLVRKRLAKIIRIANMDNVSYDICEKLTSEEKILLDSIHSAVNVFKTSVGVSQI